MPYTVGNINRYNRLCSILMETGLYHHLAVLAGDILQKADIASMIQVGIPENIYLDFYVRQCDGQSNKNERRLNLSLHSRLKACKEMVAMEITEGIGNWQSIGLKHPVLELLEDMESLMFDHIPDEGEASRLTSQVNSLLSISNGHTGQWIGDMNQLLTGHIKPCLQRVTKSFDQNITMNRDMQTV